MQEKGKVGADVDAQWKSSCDCGMLGVDIFPSVNTTHGYSGRHHQPPSLRRTAGMVSSYLGVAAQTTEPPEH